MRTTLAIFIGMLVLSPMLASADSYSRYDRWYDRDRFCDSHYGAIHSDYRRLQRSHDRLERRLASQAKNCAAASQQQQATYQQIINQQRGITADLSAQQADTNDLVQDLADAKGIPQDLLERPTREEYEALQERYDTLLHAYRNLERDHRAITGQ